MSKNKKAKKTNTNAHTNKNHNNKKSNKATQHLLQQLECETCLFTDHCDGIFCLKP